MAVWPVAMFFFLTLLVAGAMIGVSYALGERHRERSTAAPYESGMLVTGTARIRAPSHFYLVALFFVVFDLEAVYLFAWAVAARASGWLGFVEIVIFVAVLGLALVYLWRDGGLSWGTSAKPGEATRSARRAPIPGEATTGAPP